MTYVNGNAKVHLSESVCGYEIDDAYEGYRICSFDTKDDALEWLAKRNFRKASPKKFYARRF